MVSLAEWATRRLIIVIVGTAAVTSIGAGAFGRYVIPQTPDDGATASTDTKPIANPPAPSRSETPATAVVPSPEGGDAEALAMDSRIGTPSQINDLGVPVGYPHSEAGAISACGNFIAATSIVRNREPQRSRDVILSISNEETATRLSRVLAGIDLETATNFGVSSIHSPEFIFHHRVIGYRVDDYRDDESAIEILSATAAGISGDTSSRQPAMHWSTDICSISWDGADWKLRDISGGIEGHAMTERSSETFERFALAGVAS